MIGIHPVHRRLAELALEADRLNGFENLPKKNQIELFQCLRVNADMIMRLDSLKSLSLIAYEINDLDWVQDICLEIEKLEAKMV